MQFLLDYIFGRKALKDTLEPRCMLPCLLPLDIVVEKQQTQMVFEQKTNLPFRVQGSTMMTPASFSQSNP